MDGPHETSQEAIGDIVERIWGFRELRPLQEPAVRAVLEGRDSLVVLPTGGGKSLCYQLPPMISGKLSLVISPLIALMQDQIDGLTLNGYPAAALHSNCTDDEVEETHRKLEEGELRLLLVSPERAVTGGFMSRLPKMGIGAIAIDEAHCISHWGHDFRPEYRRLLELRERLPGVSLHAYTATATPRVREDIVHQLGLRDPEILIGTFDRPNLTYRVLPRVKAADQIAEILKRHENEAAIVYCMSRRETESIAESLMKRGVNASAYHAGMAPEKRRRIQDRFTTERLDVVVATVAFGMGIDRSDVRCVIHASLPKSVEAYQQETGRAGRDGLEAECVLLYSSGDARRWEQLIESSAAEFGSEPDPAQLELVRQMRSFASSMRCRHKTLSEHFGQDYEPESCGACDVCLGEVAMVPESTVVAQKILSCIARAAGDTRATYGGAYIADVLRGSRAQKILERGHDTLSTFGLLKHMRRDVIVSMIDQLVDQDLLERAPGEFPVLLLTQGSMEVLRGEREVALLSPPAPTKRSRAADGEDPLSEEQHDVFERLRGLRRRLADEHGVPPYVVFNDATLREMVRRMPASPEEMLSIKGVGQAKMQRFGDAFLDELLSVSRG
ncbi:MAG: DNA helicase RecQ [Phycisphaerales bacterium JB061]|jgi:ATP-dependent DNA helicase RecQ